MKTTDGFIKIGHTKDELARRVKNYATHSPDPPEILGYIGGPKELERQFHIRFSAYRHDREWFRYEGALLLFIERELPARQEDTEVRRLDYMRDAMEGKVKKLPRKVPREARPAAPPLRQRLVFKDGKIFNLQGKRVLVPKPGDYFVEV